MPASLNTMSELTPKANENRNAIASIRSRFLRGDITLDQAKAEAYPIIQAMNATAKVIAKQHKMPYKPITFSSLMR